MKIKEFDTIAAIATSFGEGGIGIVRISGEDAFNIANKIFVPFSKEKQNLKITLLSDIERQVIEAYGVWQEKKMYGKVSMGVVRTTFVIDEQGNIEKIFDKVKAAQNPQETLNYIKG